MVHRFPLFRIGILLMVVAISLTASADGRGRGFGSSIEFTAPGIPYESATLTVSFPNGDTLTRDYSTGRPITLRVSDLGTEIPDGQYTFEVVITPKLSNDVKKKLQNARAANDDAAARKIMREAGLSSSGYSGTFSISRGSIVDTEATEPGASSAGEESALRSQESTSVTQPRGGKVAVNDQVIPDDLIVQGSTCVGLDCVNNESFGFDTIRLKENNTRIHFDDTSTSAGFPANDWRIIANDSASGGSNKFSVEDSTGAKTPLTITAGAATNSIFVDSTGRVGFRTATPVLDLHVATSNTPALRLEQNSSGGFTAQTWDIGANEANFFVRDVTAGSRLSFRIRPGAPTSSIDISADGYVGLGGITSSIGTGATEYIAKAQVISSEELGNFIRLSNSNSTWEMGGLWQPNTVKTAGWLFGTGNAGAATLTYGSGASENAALTDAKDTGDGISITTTGNVGFNCNAPGSDFVISATTNCTGSQSSINAGSAQFTVSSSRAIKENLEPIKVDDLLDRIAKVDVYKYDFKQGAKNRLGLMAEDFHTVLGRGSDKLIDGNDVQMALWLAVQELTQQNKQLQERINALETKQQ